MAARSRDPGFAETAGIVGQISAEPACGDSRFKQPDGLVAGQSKLFSGSIGKTAGRLSRTYNLNGLYHAGGPDNISGGNWRDYRRDGRRTWLFCSVAGVGTQSGVSGSGSVAARIGSSARHAGSAGEADSATGWIGRRQQQCCVGPFGRQSALGSELVCAASGGIGCPTGERHSFFPWFRHFRLPGQGRDRAVFAGTGGNSAGDCPASRGPLDSAGVCGTRLGRGAARSAAGFARHAAPLRKCTCRFAVQPAGDSGGSALRLALHPAGRF